MNNLNLGRHISIGNGFVATPSYAKSFGYDIFQIFLGPPKQILYKRKHKDELINLSNQLKINNVKMVVHGSYTINLCHPSSEKKFISSLKSLVQDLQSSAIIGNNCLGVIIHMGKNIAQNNLSINEAINNYVQGLKMALQKSPPQSTIILETGASQGTEVGSKIPDLGYIYSKLSVDEKNRVKFCIDTCHIWATGYDISSDSGVKKFFKEFNDSIGIDKISCIHLNDSKTPLNSHVDRHADLGYGYISLEGLRLICRFAKKYNIPIIMETPLDAVNPKTNNDVTHQEELQLVKSWI